MADPGYGKLERAAAVSERLNPVAFAGRMVDDSAKRPDAQTQQDMDKLQKVVDIIGLFEPTGVADLANAVASLMRAVEEPDRRSQHVRMAAVSAIGAIPLIGSLTGAGKYVAKAGARLDRSARAAAKAVPGGRSTYAATRTMMHKHPGIGLALVRGVTKLIRVALAADSPAQKVQGWGQAVGEVGGAVNYEPSWVEGAQGLTQEGFDFYQQQMRRGGQYGERQAGRRPWSYTVTNQHLAGAAVGAGALAGAWGYSSYARRAAGGSARFSTRYPGGIPVHYGQPSMAMAYAGQPGYVARPPEIRTPRRRRSLARKALRGVGSAGRIYYENTSLSWYGVHNRLGRIPSRLALGAMGLHNKMGRAIPRVAARAGFFGPFAAHAAGGWYGNPATVARGLKSLGEALTKAVASVVVFTTALRYGNRAAIARQNEYVPYGAQMSTAAATYAMEESMRRMRMASTTGGSYAGLSRAQSRFEDTTLPYRALASNLTNRGLEFMTNITTIGFKILEATTGIRTAAEWLNELLGGGADEAMLPHQSLMQDIAAGRLMGGGPTARPRP